MKKMAVILAICYIMFALFSTSFLLPDSADNIRGPTFNLPASLARIEDEAFAGDVALREIRIPDSVAYIADDAFEDCDYITILANADSYAAKWAEEHDAAFIPTVEGASLLHSISKLLTEGFALLLPFSVDPNLLRRLRRKAENAVRSMRPQDRQELNPIDYRFP